MREMYSQGQADSSPTLTDGDSCGVDPFHDRFPWFRIIGRSYLYLSNLLFAASLIQKIPVVNEKGDVVGFLRIAIQAVTGKFLSFFSCYSQRHFLGIAWDVTHYLLTTSLSVYHSDRERHPRE